jgi:hypothetical protein
MWICCFSRPLSEVVVIAMPGVGLDTTPRVEVPPGAGELRLLVPTSRLEYSLTVTV